jgi:transmembrane sensor
LETEKLKRILRQYLLGRAREKQNTVIENWYQSFDNEPVTSLSPLEEESIRQEIWGKIQPEIHTRKVHYLKRNLAVAAAAALLLTGGVTTYLLTRTPAGAAYATITTAIGEKKTIQLADGSRLVLNAGSTVRIPKDMARERKLDIVDGEVFFDVKGNPDVPFTVQSGPLTTTVLGTSFNITAYQSLNRISVAVTAGKVSVTRESAKSAMLTKDQALTYDRKKDSAYVDVLDRSLLGWQQGILVLNDASFDDMAVLMQKNFGLILTTETQSIRETRYTTELSAAMEPVKAAEVLAAIHRLKIKVTGHEVMLYE